MFIGAKGKTVTSAGGLAATSDLAAFLVSMIAPVKKSVNHLRTTDSEHAQNATALRQSGLRE